MNWRGKLLQFCEVAGLPVLEPFVRLAAGEDRREQLASIARYILVPVAAIALFLLAWSVGAKRIKTNAGTLPGPVATWEAGQGLWRAHFEQAAAEREQVAENRREAVALLRTSKILEHQAQTLEGEAKQEKLSQAAIARERAKAELHQQPSHAPTFPEQIVRSLITVFAGFAVATLIAVPLGILCGMSPIFNAAMTPLIQVFKPVSPLAWLPIVSVLIGWIYFDTDPDKAWFEQSFLISAITVAACSLWPTLVNTALGVSSVDNDYLNVARVLKLSGWQRLIKIIIPSSLPLMFAGMRISLGVGWMVLVAADMLAQNPGLGKFVWDMFQNGSSQTMALILYAVVVIGVVGLLLDRLMVCLRNLVTFDTPSTA